MKTFLDKPNLSPPNEQGYQFGIDESLTDYAHKEVVQDKNSSLPPIKATVVQVWKDDKMVSRILIDEETNNVLEDMPGFEAMAVAIDKYKLIASMERQ